MEMSHLGVKNIKIKKMIGLCDAPSNSLIDSTMSPKVTTMEGKRVEACPLACNTSGVEGCVRVSGLGLSRMISKSITHMNLHKPNN
jgi:hypothetical protein